VTKPSISYTISQYDIEIILVDIEKNENSISICLFVTFDIEKCDPRYRTRTISLHDIDCEIFRYRCDFDIEDFDIEYFVRYRASDTRYRGAKVPDAGARVGRAWPLVGGGVVAPGGDGSGLPGLPLRPKPLRVGPSLGGAPPAAAQTWAAAAAAVSPPPKDWWAAAGP
jgi:hypothetical protein